MTVTPVDDAPVLGDIGPQKFAEDSSVTIDLKPYVTDVDTDFSAMKITVTSADGKLVESHVSDGKLVVTGVHDAYGETKLTLSVSDATTTKTQTIDVTVTDVNDLPVADHVSASAVEDVPLKIALSAHDVDSSNLTYVIKSVPADGKLYATEADASAGRNPLTVGATLLSNEVWFKTDANKNSTEPGRDFSFSYVADDHSGTDKVVYDQIQSDDVHVFKNTKGGPGTWTIDADDGSFDLAANPNNRIGVMLTGEKVTDFDLNCTAQMSGGYSGGLGVYYRISEGTNNFPTGYSFQIDPGLNGKFIVLDLVNGSEAAIAKSVSIASVLTEGFNSKTDTVATVMDGSDAWITVNGEKIFNLNAEHEISISVQGSHHVINVDGVKALDFSDSRFSEGGIGFRTWSLSATDSVHTEIKSVSVTTGVRELSEPAKVDIYVTPVDDAPVLTAPANLTTAEDTPILFAGSNLIKVTDIEADKVSVTLTAEHGTLSAAGFSGSEIKLTGSPSDVSSQLASLTFNPAPDYNGPASIKVHTVETDTSKPLAADATIAITVTPVDDAPVLSDIGPQKFAEDGSVTIDLKPYVTDVDTDFSAMKISVTSADGKLVESHVSDGKLVVTGVHDAYGETKLTLSVSDATTTKTQTIDVTVTPVNDLPVADHVSASAVEDVPLKIALSAHDVDSSNLTYVIKSVPADGKLYATEADASAGRNPLTVGATLLSNEVWFKADANKNSTEPGRDFSFSYVADDHSGTGEIVYDQFKASDIHVLSSSSTATYQIDPKDGSLDLITGTGVKREAVMITGHPVTDFELDVSAQMSGGVTGGMAVYYRVSEGTYNSANGYAFHIDPGFQNKFLVREVVDGNDKTIVANVSIAEVMKEGFNSKTDKVGTLVDGADKWITVNGEKVFNLNAEHDISISMEGSHQVINVDGIKVFDFYNSKFSEGGIGFKAWSNLASDHTDVTITSINLTSGIGGLSDPAKVDVYVSPVDDAPVLTAPSAITTA